MVPQGTKKTVARIVDYTRFYKPSIEEFVDGFEYEYVQLSLKQNHCIFYESWVKAMWGTPFSLLHIDHIKQLMKNERVRVRKRLPTSYFKELLKKQALAFHYKGMHVVVFPKKTHKKDDVEVIDNHKVYVNGVEQDMVRIKTHSKLYNRWFTNIHDDVKFDMRYLLGLNTPELPSKNVLYQFFEGVFTKDESVFNKIGENFMTGGPDNPPVLKHTAVPRGYYTMQKAKRKAMEQKDNPMSITKYKAKEDDDLSEAVLKARELATTRRLNRTVVEEVKAALKAQRAAERKTADEKNREKMKLQAMICVQNEDTGRVFRVPMWKAINMTKDGSHTFTEKYMWKTQLRLDRETRKKEAEKNRVAPSGINRVVIRANKNTYKKLARNKFARKKMSNFATLQTIKGKYQKDEKGNTVVEPYTIQAAEGTYEFEPVFKKIWRKVFDKDTDKFLKMELIKTVPWMIPYKDEESGKTVLKQALKRVFKRKSFYDVDLTRKQIATPKKTITVEEFPQRTNALKKMPSEKKQATA